MSRLSGGVIPPSTHTRILAVVARIPRGRVATYGQVAKLAGLPRGARQVGRALATLPEGSPLSWHRVVAETGRIALRGASAVTQRLRLLAEGVAVTAGGRIDLREWRWRPRGGYEG